MRRLPLSLPPRHGPTPGCICSHFDTQPVTRRFRFAIAAVDTVILDLPELRHGPGRAPPVRILQKVVFDENGRERVPSYLHDHCLVFCRCAPRRHGPAIRRHRRARHGRPIRPELDDDGCGVQRQHPRPAARRPGRRLAGRSHRPQARADRFGGAVRPVLHRHRSGLGPLQPAGGALSGRHRPGRGAAQPDRPVLGGGGYTLPWHRRQPDVLRRAAGRGAGGAGRHGRPDQRLEGGVLRRRHGAALGRAAAGPVPARVGGLPRATERQGWCVRGAARLSLAGAVPGGHGHADPAAVDQLLLHPDGGLHAAQLAAGAAGRSGLHPSAGRHGADPLQHRRRHRLAAARIAAGSLASAGAGGADLCRHPRRPGRAGPVRDLRQHAAGRVRRRLLRHRRATGALRAGAAVLSHRGARHRRRCRRGSRPSGLDERTAGGRADAGDGYRRHRPAPDPDPGAPPTGATAWPRPASAAARAWPC